MKMKTLLLSMLLGVMACTSREAKVPQPPPSGETVKPGAPTQLDAQLAEGSAALTLRFDGPGERVTVAVSGVDGVTVSSPAETLSFASVKAGEARPLDVRFTRGPTRGHLVVSVHGTFSGAERARVHTVMIDGPVPKTGTTQVTNDGDVVKVIP